MNFKKAMLTILVLIFILNIGAACASDYATDEIISSDATDEIISSDTTDEILSADQDIGDDTLNIPNAADGEGDALTQGEDSSIMESAENTESVTDYGGLVSAVSNAKKSNGTNYTINLEDGTYEYTSSISWGGSSSVKTLIINGNNQVVDGKQKATFITIENGYTLILNDITISNFKTTSAGGAISAKTTSTLNTNNAIFKDNSGRNGAAIWIQNGKVSLFNTTFKSNTATVTGAAVWAGNGNLLIERCNFIENTATGTAGGALYVGPSTARIVNSNFTGNKNTKGSGAAIYNDMKDLTVESCIFTNNSAKKGGAIYSDSSITVQKSEFVENEASAEGGAIFTYGSSSANIIENTFVNDKAPAGAEISSNKGLVEDNTIMNSAGDEAVKGTITQENNKVYEAENIELVRDYADLVSAIGHAKTCNATNYTINLQDGTYQCTSAITWGGASSVKTLIINGNNQTVDGRQKASFITIENGYTLILNDITISNFKQTSAGGALFAKSTCTLKTNNVIFKDNTGRNGVAIWIQKGDAHIFNTTFIHNTASVTGASVWAGLGSILIEECNFIENTATGTAGGAVYVGSTNARIINSNFTGNKNTKGSGAAIYNDMISLTVENCIFTNNTAKKGGAVYSESTITVQKSEFVENEASVEGGAIFTYGSSTANIIENTFMNDKAPVGAEISSNNGLLKDNTIMNSAAFDAIKGTITQENNKFYEAENTEAVRDYAGLISAVNNAKKSTGSNYTINLKDGTYECTSGISWGGASSIKTLIINGNNQTVDGKQKASFITIENGYTLILNDMTITNFKQTSAGGAISAKSTSTLNTNNVIFKDNTGRNGVAIWIQNGKAHIFNTTFIHNTASATGASVWAGLGSILIEECNFIENTATGTAGGAVYVGSTNARIINSNFTNNKNTKGSGAAIYNDMNSLTVENCIFTNNSAKKGGAVYSESTITVEKSTFVENEASVEGGAIFTYGSSTANIIESTFMNNKAPAGAEISSNKGLLENNTIINSAAEGAIKGTITQENNKIYDSEMAYLIDQITDPVLKKYLELQYQEQKNIINELNSTLNELDEANAKIDDLNSTLDQTLSELDEANAKIDDLNSTLNQTLSELDEANAKIDDLNSTLNQTLSELDVANNNISNLTEQVANATTQLADVTAQLGEVQKEIQNLSGDLISTKITAKALTIQTLNKGKLEITLTDGNGTVLANKTIYVFVNGVTKQLTTNVNGTARLSVKFLKAGTYAPLITYMGDKTYSASMAAGKITVTKKATSIIAPKSTFKVNQKTKKVKITLKSGKNVVAGKKVTIYVNGKTFSAKTNSKGVALITVKLTKTGSFKYIAKFAGDGAYKATSKKGYIVIKK